MRKINAVLHGIIIVGCLYAFLALGNWASILIVFASASAIATTLSHQKKSLAWFAYISNILCGTLVFISSFMVMFGGSAQSNGAESMVTGLVLLVVSFPFIVSIFFIKIRYFPSKLKTAS